MQSNYKVELTPTAEQDYSRLHDEAEASISKGDDSGPPVAFLASVETAIDETLSINPFDQSRALAGIFSLLFRLKLSLGCIYYTPDAEPLSVCVLRISTRKDDAELLSWLAEAIRNGEMTDLLKQWGIDAHALQDALHDAPTVSRWTN